MTYFLNQILKDQDGYLELLSTRQDRKIFTVFAVHLSGQPEPRYKNGKKVFITVFDYWKKKRRKSEYHRHN